ncbi:MAG: hypothetical protein IME96_06875 [Proteobacteria bacterium]|nr:hypothetical protein [Pseudomonadota bacterium]
MDGIYLYSFIAVAFVFFLYMGYSLSERIPKKRKDKGREIALPGMKATQNKEEAAQALLTYLNEEFFRTGREIALYDGIDCRDGSGWLFFWDTHAFIMSKDPSVGFKGSNPVYYNKSTGEIKYVPQHLAMGYIGKAEGKTSGSE